MKSPIVQLGKWEEKLFEKGAKRFGWGRWSKIADVVGSRGKIYKEQSSENRLQDIVADTAQSTKMYLEKLNDEKAESEIDDDYACDNYSSDDSD